MEDTIQKFGKKIGCLPGSKSDNGADDRKVLAASLCKQLNKKFREVQKNLTRVPYRAMKRGD